MKISLRALNIMAILPSGFLAIWIGIKWWFGGSDGAEMGGIILVFMFPIVISLLYGIAHAVLFSVELVVVGILNKVEIISFKEEGINPVNFVAATLLMGSVLSIFIINLDGIAFLGWIGTLVFYLAFGLLGPVLITSAFFYPRFCKRLSEFSLGRIFVAFGRIFILSLLLFLLRPIGFLVYGNSYSKIDKLAKSPDLTKLVSRDREINCTILSKYKMKVGGEEDLLALNEKENKFYWLEVRYGLEAARLLDLNVIGPTYVNDGVIDRLGYLPLKTVEGLRRLASSYSWGYILVEGRWTSSGTNYQKIGKVVLYDIKNNLLDGYVFVESVDWRPCPLGFLEKK